MKTRTKALLLTLCAVVLTAVTAYGTYAYFTDSDSATNTFTVGSVGIKLDEAKVNADGSYATNDTNRTSSNEYHLIPGHTYIKDPTVTVDTDSEEAYIRMMVKVENIDSLKQAMPKADFPTYYNGDLFLLQMLCVDENGDSTWDGTKWLYEGFGNGVYEFRYYTTANGTSGPNYDGVLESLFEKITVPGEITKEQLAHLKDVKIVVTAHAMQAPGFDDANDAWAAFEKQVNP